MHKLLFFLLLPLSLQAFQQPSKVPGNQTTVICKIVGAPVGAEYISLYEQIGLAYKEVARGNRQPDSSFMLSIPAGKPRLYNIGFNETMNGRIVLGDEKAFTLYANAQYLDLARTIGSPANKALENMRKKVDFFRAESDRLRLEYRQARIVQEAEPIKTASDNLAALTKNKTRYLDSLKAANPLLWRSATLQISPDYYEGRPGFTDEFDFYSKEFFGFANLSDPGYEETPDVLEAFHNYVLMLSQLGANPTACKNLVEIQLAKLPAGTKTQRRAMSGVVTGMRLTNHPEYAYIAKKYVDTFRNNDMGDIAQLEFELKRNATFIPGMEAPDLVGQTPDGGSYALSKLRGKVVLIDFWASWCGPCRRENPNVVTMYGKYKDKGFDILGVSLDREEGAWKKAIEADGLIWHHISDLKGWQSEHAKLYSVNSIPQTLLIDREGKIIQRNLRGEELRNKLQEIFGE